MYSTPKGIVKFNANGAYESEVPEIVAVLKSNPKVEAEKLQRSKPKAKAADSE